MHGAIFFFMRRVALLAAVFIAVQPAVAGLLLKLKQGERMDALVVPNAAFYIPAGSAPGSLLEPGEFEAEMTGFVSVDLRGLYAFQLEASGSAELLINGQQILSMTAPGKSEVSRRVRLNKGTNALMLKLTPPNNGAAQVRLFWKPRNVAKPVPIPAGALKHDEADAELRNANLVRAGAMAFAEYRCARCHAVEEGGWREFEMDAPSLEGIGSRLRQEWMEEWIADPQKVRPGARMPRTVSREDAADIAAHLASLALSGPVNSKSGNAGNGEKLYSTLQCGTCHDGDEPRQISLRTVSRKFQPGAIADYLLDPQAHYRWNPMPNFKLAKSEAADLEAFLFPPVAAEVTRPGSVRGRALMESSGCVKCHGGAAATDSRSPTLKQIATAPEKGCLDPANDHSPRYTFAESERQALGAFVAGARASGMPMDSPIETAMRRSEALRCASCHDRADGVIRLELIGGKLKPEWAEAFLRDAVPYKPRPWLAARMPSFSMHARDLAAGLAALHGLPPESRKEGALSLEQAGVGAKLISAAGGFSCVACHAVGASSGAMVVESPGINLAYAAERLQKGFFHRWILNPLALDPTTKMPVYFDENGQSQLVEILEGDGEKQIEAMWQYVRLGPEMPPPPAP